MKIISVFCAIYLSITMTFAQNELLYQDYSWDESPKWEKLSEELEDEQEVGLLYHRIVEFAYVEEHNGNLFEYFTLHKKIRVNNDDAIQANNKVYIGMNGVLDLIDAKARVITPEGEVIDFDKSNIIDNVGENGEIEYKNFAIDGVVKGSDIEYTYTVLRNASYEGTIFTFQTDKIRTNVSFTLASPDNLVFKYKSYNGFPELVTDTSYSEKNVSSASIDVIKGLKEEDYSAYEKNLMSLVYKLHKNKGTGKSNFISFGTVSQNIYSFYYKELEKKDEKALSKLINASGANKETNLEKKIRLLEAYIKSNIAIVDVVPLKPIAQIINDKYTTKRGLVFMMTHAIEKLGIKHEIVITTDRSENYFDKDFEYYSVLNNVMIYFPEIDSYLAPNEEMFRLGLVPDEWTAQNGLFIKAVSVGDMKTGLGKVKYIKPMVADKTHDNMDVEVVFDDLFQPTVKFKRDLLGYTSVYFQAVYNLIDEDNKKELDESLIMFSDSKGELLNYNVEGIEVNDVGINPVVYKGELKTSSLMEKAGNRFLFNVGQLIGPQHEMYKERKREMDIEHSHNMVYNRTIRFEIPDGYELSGLEKLKINETYPEENPSIRFVSDYTINENSVEITVVERYDEILFDKTEIDEFRRIINAAANFNKVVLFLVKK